MEIDMLGILYYLCRLVELKILLCNIRGPNIRDNGLIF